MAMRFVPQALMPLARPASVRCPTSAGLDHPQLLVGLESGLQRVGSRSVHRCHHESMELDKAQISLLVLLAKLGLLAQTLMFSQVKTAIRHQGTRSPLGTMSVRISQTALLPPSLRYAPSR